MGTIRRLTDIQLASVGTTKVYSINSNETLFQISSGNRAFEAGNLGNYNIFYGQSNLLATSGLFLSASGGIKFWDTVTDNFKMYFVVGSVGVVSQLIIQEYAGN